MNKLSKEKKVQLALVAIGHGRGDCRALAGAALPAKKEDRTTFRQKSRGTQQEIKKVQNVMVEAEKIEAALNESTTNLNAIEATMPSGDLYSWMVSTLRQFNAPSYRVDLPQIGVPSISEVRMFPKFSLSSGDSGGRGDGILLRLREISGGF